MSPSRDPFRPTRILEAASRLISHYGFDKTTMEDIAREAGVSKGSLYLEWTSKEELLDALLVFEMKRYLMDYQRRIDDDPQGGQIANLYQHSIFALQCNPLIRALYTRDNRVLGDFIRRQDPQRYTSRMLFEKDFILQMQKAGQLRTDLRPEMIAYLFGVITIGVIQIGAILPATEIPPLEEIASGLIQMVQDGLGASGGDGEAGKQAVHHIVQYVLEQYEKK